jgi:toxin-antitoxin system PIN domain toxin
MRLVDANILVYAHVSGFSQHEAARTWLDAGLNGLDRLGLPWPSMLTFLRLVTNPRVFARPESMADAWRQVGQWLSCRAAWVPMPTERHREFLGRCLETTGLRSNHVPDADLAALALEHGLTLCSTDSDFARFAGLRWENPLA